MIEPKNFYRKMDLLISAIAKEKTIDDALPYVLRELEKTFGEDLRFENGIIYEEEADEFVLMKTSNHHANNKRQLKVARSSEAVRKVLRHGSYIYDDPALSIDIGIGKEREYAIPAAFSVRSPEKSWIFVFELKSGWIREEIEFCFNAIRTALNYQLFSQAVQGDLEQAAYIQQSLLPAHPPVIEGYSIAGRSQPAEIVGGDLFDYYLFDEELFGVVIGDASGHGLPASLLVRDVVTGLRMGMEKEMKIVYTLKKLNRVIHRSTYSTRFISLFYAEVEKDGNIIYANAGHPPPLLVKDGTIIELKATGIILGAMAEMELQRAYARFDPGDLLLMYSDGIYERTNRQQDMMGIDGLKTFILAHKEKSAEEIVEQVFHYAYTFGNNAHWQDDATVIAIKRQGK